MIYHVFLNKPCGEPSPFGPSKIYASGLVDAQRKAEATLQGCHRDKALLGWTIHTGVEAP